MNYTDEQLANLSDERMDLLRRTDLETFNRALSLQSDFAGFTRRENEKQREAQLRNRKKELAFLQQEREIESRITALKAPPVQPVQRVVSNEAITKETLEQICKKRGVTKRQFTDEELKRLPVKRNATPKDIQLLRSKIWDDYLFRAKDSETLRKPVPHFLLLAAREMLEVELFVLRNELETKVGTDRVGELMMQIAELQRDVADLKASKYQLEEERIG